MGSVKSFEDLFVWQRSLDFVEEIYRLVKKLPREEVYELSSQMRRAVVSISSNIAEGQARGSTKEFINFLNYACGSNAEVYTQLIICSRLGYISKSDLNRAIALSNEVGRLLNLLINSLKDK